MVAITRRLTDRNARATKNAAIAATVIDTIGSRVIGSAVRARPTANTANTTAAKMIRNPADTSA